MFAMGRYINNFIKKTLQNDKKNKKYFKFYFKNDKITL